MEGLKVITLFSGYDSQCLALNRLGISYDLVAWCEIDKYAIKAHDALFPQWADRNLGDVSTVDWTNVPNCDLLTYSFPCTNISMAGRQEGLEENSGTASSLLWECRKAIDVLRPKYLVMENVANLLSSRHKPYFDSWCMELEDFRYTNFYKILNAKDYGVPQNRNRVFMVSIHGEGQQYFWPKPFKLERRLKDVLEQEVPESYYLSEDRIQGLLDSTRKEEEEGRGFAFEPKDGSEDYANSVTTNAGGRETDNFIIEPQVLGWSRDEKGNIIDRHPVDVANCVTSGKRDNTQNYVRESSINVEIKINEGQSGRIYGTDGIYPTVDSSASAHNRRLRITDHRAGMRIRRLTERELFRLMDVDDTDIDTLLSAGISKTQLAKMAGNSIVVNVLYHIFKRLLVDMEAEHGEQMKLF